MSSTTVVWKVLFLYKNQVIKMLSQFIREKNLSPSTIRNYTSSVKIYEKQNNKSLNQLILEAEHEENLKIPWKKRKIKKRLINFRSYLYKNKVQTTAVKYMTNIKTIYRHFEIELQTLPSFNSNQIIKPAEIKFRDLPTKKDIKMACQIADATTRLIILLIATSGLSKAEILNLKTNDFLKACESDIPTFYLTRQKTAKEFFTFTTPKTAEEIAEYIKKHELKEDEKLFDISESQLTKNMQRINDELKLGKIRKYSRFRCHMLRKYHASNLLNNTSFTIDEIDVLQARAKNKIHRSYFLNDEEKLKEKYRKHLDTIGI